MEYIAYSCFILLLLHTSMFKLEVTFSQLGNLCRKSFLRKLKGKRKILVIVIIHQTSLFIILSF